MREAMLEPVGEGVFMRRAGGNITTLGNYSNTTLRTAGIPVSKRLSAYSFRHTLKEAMRRAGVRDDLQKRLMGHSESGAAADMYGSPTAALVELRAAIEAAVPLLGLVDLDIYSAEERVTQDAASPRI
jgi:integrase